MLLGFSLTTTPFLSGPSHPHGYLLRTSFLHTAHYLDSARPTNGCSQQSLVCLVPLALVSHISYLGLYAYTQTMIFLTLKRESGPFFFSSRVFIVIER